MKPTVSYLHRTYLKKTSNHIYYQYKSHIKYNAIFFTYNINIGKDFPDNNIYSPRNYQNNLQNIYRDFVFKYFKRMLRKDIRFFKDIIVNNNVKVFHCHFAPNMLYFYHLKKITGLPLITSFYGYDCSVFPFRYKGLGKIYLRYLFNRGELFTAMSEDMKSDLIKLGCPREKIEIIHPAIEVKNFYFDNKRYSHKGKNTKFLTVSSFVPKKGHLFLLKSFYRAIRENNNIYLDIYGDGPLKNEIIREIDQLGLGEKVKVKGFIEPYDLPKLFHQYDIFIHPSVKAGNNKEGIPIVILEAMACGMPIISTYHAGIPDAVHHNINGFLVNENDIDQLKNSIIRMADEKNKWKEYGYNSRQIIEKSFNREIQIKKLELLYDSLWS